MARKSTWSWGDVSGRTSAPAASVEGETPAEPAEAQASQPAKRGKGRPKLAPKTKLGKGLAALLAPETPPASSEPKMKTGHRKSAVAAGINAAAAKVEPIAETPPAASPSAETALAESRRPTLPAGSRTKLAAAMDAPRTSGAGSPHCSAGDGADRVGSPRNPRTRKPGSHHRAFLVSAATGSLWAPHAGFCVDPRRSDDFPADRRRIQPQVIPWRRRRIGVTVGQKLVKGGADGAGAPLRPPRARPGRLVRASRSRQSWAHLKPPRSP